MFDSLTSFAGACFGAGIAAILLGLHYIHSPETQRQYPFLTHDDRIAVFFEVFLPAAMLLTIPGVVLLVIGSVW